MEAQEDRSNMGETYEIRIQGHLPSRWLSWFEGFTITNLENGETILCGRIIDQSELHGILARIRDLNIKLISVNRVE